MRKDIKDHHAKKMKSGYNFYKVHGFLEVINHFTVNGNIVWRIMSGEKLITSIIVTVIDITSYWLS